MAQKCILFLDLKIFLSISFLGMKALQLPSHFSLWWPCWPYGFVSQSHWPLSEPFLDFVNELLNTQFEPIKFLAKFPNKVFTPNLFLESLWGECCRLVAFSFSYFSSSILFGHLRFTTCMDFYFWYLSF